MMLNQYLTTNNKDNYLFLFKPTFDKLNARLITEFSAD